jgi:hypothetical protein
MTIKHVRKWTLALALVLLGAGVALATVSFNEDTGVGFIGRGDVIDHPDLGKGSLVDEPIISFANTGHHEQVCFKTGPGNNTFRRGDELVGYQVQRETRKAPGSGNITGYLLNGQGTPIEPSDPPTTLCPPAGGWSPVTDVTFVPDGGGQLFFDDQKGGVGAWEFDETTSTWVPVDL